MPTDRASSDIVKLIVILGCEFNLRIIGQGIETAVQLTRLKETGCEFGQGYFLSKPLTSEQAANLLRQQYERGVANTAGRS
jgi:EAL domain-containing protein (putative c-di-GMP-specific phosphodiesterase class I)